MSLRPMTRQCIHCRRIYHYNPSVGDPGLVCKYCSRVQLFGGLGPLPQPAPSDKEMPYVHL